MRLKHRGASHDIFLDRHPEVRQYFIGVNLHHQAAMLQGYSGPVTY